MARTSLEIDSSMLSVMAWIAKLFVWLSGCMRARSGPSGRVSDSEPGVAWRMDVRSSVTGSAMSVRR